MGPCTQAEQNLWTADVEALVNPVNTQGIMGKGLALQFKKAFPENLREYEQACKAGLVAVGAMFVVERLALPRYIVNFPTKRSWRPPGVGSERGHESMHDDPDSLRGVAARLSNASVWHRAISNGPLLTPPVRISR